MFLKHLRTPALFATTLAECARALADYQIDILPPASPIAQEAYDLHFGKIGRAHV